MRALPARDGDGAGSSSPRVVELRRHVDAPPDAVWALLADPYSYRRWVAGTGAIRRADESWPAVGARLEHRFGPLLLRSGDHTTVLESEPPHRLVLAAHARPYGSVRADLELTPDGPGTEVLLRERLVDGLGARFPRIGRVVQLARNHRSLVRLAGLAERRLRSEK